MGYSSDLTRRFGRVGVQAPRRTATVVQPQSAESVATQKGVKRGACNRSACLAPGAIFFNSGSRAYYCPKCAREINRANGQELCKIVDPDIQEELDRKSAEIRRVRLDATTPPATAARRIRL